MKVFFKSAGEFIEVKEIKPFFTELGYKNKYYEGSLEFGLWYKGKKYPQFAGLDFKVTGSKIIYSKEKKAIVDKKAERGDGKLLPVYLQQVIATKIVETRIRYNQIRETIEELGGDEKPENKLSRKNRWLNGNYYPAFEGFIGPKLEGGKVYYVSKVHNNRIKVRSHKKTQRGQIARARRLQKAKEENQTSTWRKLLKFS